MYIERFSFFFLLHIQMNRTKKKGEKEVVVMDVPRNTIAICRPVRFYIFLPHKQMKEREEKKNFFLSLTRALSTTE